MHTIRHSISGDNERGNTETRRNIEGGMKMSMKDELKTEIEKKRNLALSMYKEIDDLEQELKELPPHVTIVNVYLHSSKEAMYEEGKQEGLSDKQLELFVHACSEVKVTLSVNEDGDAEIIAVDNRPFKEEE